MMNQSGGNNKLQVRVSACLLKTICIVVNIESSGVFDRDDICRCVVSDWFGKQKIQVLFLVIGDVYCVCI